MFKYQFNLLFDRALPHNHLGISRRGSACPWSRCSLVSIYISLACYDDRRFSISQVVQVGGRRGMVCGYI
jgi:hypothetical protein